MHEDHRNRIKSRFIKDGINTFDPHGILELLLFFSIPQKDTNELAHELLDRFGSLSALFDLPYDTLITIPGISGHTATLFKLIPALSQIYVAEKSKGTVQLTTVDEIGKYLVARYVGVIAETVMLLLFDNKFNLIDCITVHIGSVNSSAITVRKLIEMAMSKRASMVVLAHNHPSGLPFPSSDDIRTTKAIQKAFEFVEIGFLAHIIVAGNQFIDVLREE